MIQKLQRANVLSPHHVDAHIDVVDWTERRAYHEILDGALDGGVPKAILFDDPVIEIPEGERRPDWVPAHWKTRDLKNKSFINNYPVLFQALVTW